MQISSLYPVLMSDDVRAAATFYRSALDLETTFETDWYVSLRSDTFELALLDRHHPSVPGGFGRPAGGVLINAEVEDVDAVHERLTGDLGLAAVSPLRDEAFGQRHFIVAAPDGVLLDVISPIAPSADYTAAYEPGAVPG